MTELTKQVAAGDDDGYAYPSSIDATNYIFFGHSGASSLRSFHRFTNVTIPAGATITAAKLQFRCAYERSGTCNVKAHFEAADNPGAPTTYSDLTSRSLTTGTAWNSVELWTVNNWYDSVDIKSELQEVIDRAGWSSGNAVTVHVVDNSSSSGAQRQSYSYNNSAASAAKLVVTYTTPVSADFSDAAGVGDAADGISLTDSMSDAAGIGDAVEGEYYSPFVDLSDSAVADDAVEGYDFAGVSTDGLSVDDAISVAIEVDAQEADQAGAGDLAAGGAEIEKGLSDVAGCGDASEALNWTAWIDQNLSMAVARYYCTITGINNATTDIEVPISSFNARKRSGYSTYLSVVVPGVAYASAISERKDGDIVIDMAYRLSGVESLREEIARAEIEEISIQEGPSSRSITLTGHIDQTFVAKESRLYSPIYKARTDGALSYRFAVPDLWLNPGDTAQVDDDEFTVNTVIYMVSAGGGQTTMEVQE